MKEKITKNKKGIIQILLLIGIIVVSLILAAVIGYGNIPNSELITTTTTNTAIPLTALFNTTTTTTTTLTTTTTTTSGSLNTKNTVQEEKTITSGYDYSKLINKYRSRALYIECAVKVIKSHEYLDPLLKDLEGPDEDKKITALLQFSSDSNFISSEHIALYRNYQSNLKLRTSLIEFADNTAKNLKNLYELETLSNNTLNASGFLLTDKVFLTANHVNAGISSLSQLSQQYTNEWLAQVSMKDFIDFLFDFRISCYVQPFNSPSKYLIKLPFTELGSDIAVGYLDQPIPTDNLQSFSLCKESPKIGSSVYALSYPESRFLDSFGKILNIISQLNLTTGGTVTGDIYLTDMDTIPGSSGGGVIVYTENSDCLFGVNFAGDLDNKLFSGGKSKSYATGILPYINKIKAIMQEK